MSLFALNDYLGPYDLLRTKALRAHYVTGSCLVRLAPLAVSHVGITVPDIFAATRWYGEVFGLTHLMGPRLLSVEEAPEARSVFGTRFRSLLQAHLISGNGVGFELFEPLDPKPEPPDETLHYLRQGPWHVALMHPDVEALAQRVVAKGGSLHSPPSSFVPGRPWRLAYTRDPWWTTIEIVSHSYAEMFGNWPQPGTEHPSASIGEDQVQQLRREAND